jgi:hypothetical protein
MKGQTKTGWSLAVATLVGVPLAAACSNSTTDEEQDEHTGSVQQAVGQYCRDNSYCYGNEYCANGVCKALTCSCPTSPYNHTCVYTGCTPKCPPEFFWNGAYCSPGTYP